MRIVWLIVLLLVVGAGYYAYTRMERVPPVVGTLTSPAFAGSEYHHLFRFNDDGSGVRHVHIWLEAGGKTYELAEQEYPGNTLTGAELSLEREIEVVVKSKELGLGDGQARLMAEATDYSWLANTTQVQIPLAIDTTPPRAPLLTGLTYVRRGGSPLDGYLKINRELRKENDAQVFELCKKSSVDRLWSGPFLQMPNTHAGAKFAERRSYVYQGKTVDQQTHMGYDFASTSHADVPAANDGVVVFAGPLGIYGNAVIVDHGLGLFSLYGHLPGIGVRSHSAVVKGEALGKTGTTGLAGGDHLHFAMLLDGVFVDPLEWFDKKWLEDHIEGKLSAKPPSGG